MSTQRRLKPARLVCPDSHRCGLLRGDRKPGHDRARVGIGDAPAVRRKGGERTGDARLDKPVIHCYTCAWVCGLMTKSKGRVSLATVTTRTLLSHPRKYHHLRQVLRRCCMAAYINTGLEVPGHVKSFTDICTAGELHMGRKAGRRTVVVDPEQLHPGRGAVRDTDGARHAAVQAARAPELVRHCHVGWRDGLDLLAPGHHAEVSVG